MMNKQKPKQDRIVYKLYSRIRDNSLREGPDVARK
jgi:hypothetical protein